MSRSSEFSVPRWRRSPARPSSRPPFARPIGPRWPRPEVLLDRGVGGGGKGDPSSGWVWGSSRTGFLSNPRLVDEGERAVNEVSSVWVGASVFFGRRFRRTGGISVDS